MNRYMFTVQLQVEVEAFDPADAEEAIQDCFGVGAECGLEIKDTKVVARAELREF